MIMGYHQGTREIVWVIIGQRGALVLETDY